MPSLTTAPSASLNMVSIESNSLQAIGWTPHERRSCRWTFRLLDIAIMGSGGLYLDTRRAVFPVLVGATIAFAPTCVAVSHAANAKASSLLRSDHPLLPSEHPRLKHLNVSTAPLPTT